MSKDQIELSTEDVWKPKVIIFDLLTALLDSWSLWDASTPSETPEEGRRWRARYLELTFGSTAYVPYEGLVQQSARDTGIPESAPAALLRDWQQLKPWPGVVAVLDQLRTNGYRLGVVTNCSKELGHAAARCAHLSDGSNPFDIVLTAEEIGFYKPTKEAYRAILDVMNVRSGEALFVAGSAGDVQGATNAGMRVVWHNNIGLAPKGEARPLKEAKTLRDLLHGFL